MSRLPDATRVARRFLQRTDGVHVKRYPHVAEMQAQWLARLVRQVRAADARLCSRAVGAAACARLIRAQDRRPRGKGTR